MRRITPNQVAAYNLTAGRQMRGLTQEELGERLEQATGKRWSKATISALERTFVSSRTRHFTADDLVALSFALGLPVGWFFLPPPRSEGTTVAVGDEEGAIELTAGSLLDMAYGGSEQISPAFADRLSDLPADERVGPSEVVAERVRDWMATVVANELGDLAVWAENLRHLAGVFDETWQRVEDDDEMRVIADVVKGQDR